MAEFTQTMSGDSRYSIKLTVTEVVPSDYVTTNKTNVNYTLTATKSGGSGYWNNNTNNPVKVTINDTDVVNTNVAYDFRNATPKTITLASGTVTGIEHNADGSKTIAVSGYFKDNGNSLGQATASGNLTLTTIPRASIPTVDEAPWDYLGNTLTIRTNRASNSFTHTLKFKVGNTQIGSAVTGVGATYSWTPAISTYAPYTTSGLYAYVAIECTTYNGSTQIGTPQTTSMLMYVPANSTTAPDCSISIQEDNATMKTLNWGVYVKGKSQLKVSLTGTPKYYGYITDYSISINNSTVKSGTNTATGTFTTTYTTNILTSSGSVTASVKDNRGSTTQATAQSYTLQDYSNPQITTSQVYRCDSSGNQDDSGTYIKYIYGGSISSVSNKNSKTFTLRYRPKNGSWTTVSDSSWNSSYTCSKTAVLSGFSTSTEYEFEFSATDSFTTTPITKEIGTEPDMMNFNASGKSMAIGGISQRSSSDKALDVFVATEFYKATYFDDFAYGKYRPKRVAQVGSDNASSAGWYKVCSSTMSGYGNTNIVWLIKDNYDNGKVGIFDLEMRSNSSNIGVWKAQWLTKTGFGTGSIRVVISGMSWTLYINRTAGQYGRISFIELQHNNINGDNNSYSITYYNSTTKESSEPSGTSSTLGGDVNWALYSDNTVNATNSNYGKTLEAKDGRISNANITHYYDNDKAHCKLLLASASMTSNKPTQGDGYILCFNWDNSGQYIGQLFVPNNKDTNLQFRGCSAGTWGSWRTIPFKDEHGCAMLTLSSNYSFSGATTWTNTVVPFSGRSTLTNSNTTLFEQSSNGIKCKFAGWVQVTGTVCNDKTNEFDAVILKGTTQVIRQINTAGKQSLASTIVQVANGDVINLGFYTGNTSGTIYNNSNLIVTRIS